MCFRKGEKTKIHLTGGKIEPSSASSWCGLIKGTRKYSASTLDVSLQVTDEWTHYCIKCIWGEDSSRHSFVITSNSDSESERWNHQPEGWDQWVGLGDGEYLGTCSPNQDV
jgi:hypothetical protein